VALYNLGLRYTNANELDLDEAMRCFKRAAAQGHAKAAAEVENLQAWLTSRRGPA
jgi:TPR repeat protein